MIVLRQRLLLLLLLFVGLTEATAQYDPSYSHYWAMEPAFNPAAVGKQDKLNVVMAYNMSMVGFKHNPKTMYFSGDLPLFALGAYHGLGGQFVSDQIGLFSHNRFTAQYAYRMKLFGGKCDHRRLSVSGSIIP